MNQVETLFRQIAQELMKNLIHAEKVGPDTVFQAANLKNRALVNKIMEYLVLPGSRIENAEVLAELGRRSKAGESCLLLMEHYSNFDLPTFYYLLEQESCVAKDLGAQIIAMAGMKLNEEETFVRAFTEAYTRIVIYPSRSMEKLYVEGQPISEELQRARSINRAALHAMVRRKHEGHVILVYPSGTRYRPGQPETKRGLREMDSYIKSFDHILFIGAAGNTLRINEAGPMSQDIPTRDHMVFYCDTEIVSSDAFRAAVRPAEGEDPKQAVADAIMARLEALHQKAEAIHATLA